MKKFLLVLALGLVAFTAAACNGEIDPDPTTPDETPVDTPDPTETEDVVDVSWQGVDTAIVRPFGFGANPFPEDEDDLPFSLGVEKFDRLRGVRAHVDGTDVTHLIQYLDNIDQYREGEYVVVYHFTFEGQTHFRARTIDVDGGEDWTPILGRFPTGEISYQFAGMDTRHNLFAALEASLLETMYGGVPVFANAGFAMYSDRLDLPVDEFLPVMGFSALRGTLTEDDSTVTMPDGNPGNAGEFTFRLRLGQNPDTLHQWIYSDATSSDVISMFLDNLFYFEFNEERDGWQVLPSMAADMPLPMDVEVLPTGAEVATTWQISLREDLVWTFHELTDTDGLTTDIDAHDFIDTYKLAIDEGWFRAISGGGDFMTPPQEIRNAQAYRDGDVDWEDVGLRAVDDYTLEFRFAETIDEWGVIYWLSSFVMTPIHLGLYEEVGEAYGTTADTTAYHGPFVLDYYEPDQVLELSENPNFHSPDRYSITGINFIIIADAEVAFQEFLAGGLDSVGVPGAEYEDNADDPRMRRIPGATTFRLMINMLENQYRQDRMFPDSNFTPEPILASQWFRLAMYYAIDRETLAFDVLVTSAPQQFLYTEAYMVEPASGLSFRVTDQHYLVAEGRSPETYGFAPDRALFNFEIAVEEMVEAGYYSAGDTIELELLIFSGSDAQVAFGEFIKDSFESIFYHEDLDIGVEVIVEPKDFPGIYFDWMMEGRFDLSIGGIAGGTLNASSFMDVFADDNRGGFTLNWGIDTSSPNIAVNVFDPEVDDFVTQIWSFNAIQRALVGTVFVNKGMELQD